MHSAISAAASAPAVRTAPAASVLSQGRVPASSGRESADLTGTGIGALIHAEHRRIMRLFGALEDVARRDEGRLDRLALRHVWVRLADLLELHTEAEEEICFPAMFGYAAEIPALTQTAIADHGDIREAVAEARLLETGCARWWRTVIEARRDCSGHFRREERDLTTLCRYLPQEANSKAARQWETFAAVRGRPL